MEHIIRITTAGNVDDGKSTLIGRLLYEHDCIKEDQWEDIGLSRDEMKNNPQKLAQIADGLKSEREKNITMDVAHKFFEIDGQKYMLYDAPGHKEYTNKMFSASTNADILILLIDINKNIEEQSYTHIQIASMLEIPLVLFALNKIDLQNNLKDVLILKTKELKRILKKFPLQNHRIIPISALNGENVISSSNRYDINSKSLWEEIVDFKNEEKSNKVDLIQVQKLYKQEDDKDYYLAKAFFNTIEDNKFWFAINKTEKPFELKLLSNINNQIIFYTKKLDFVLKTGTMVTPKFTFNKYRISNTVIAKVFIFEKNNFNKNTLLFQFSQGLFSGTIKNMKHLCLKKESIHDMENSYLEITLALDQEILICPYKVNKDLGNFLLIDAFSKRTIGAACIQ